MMANFPGLIMTNKGRDMQAAAMLGDAFEFTRVSIGAGDMPADIEGLNQLVDARLSLNIQDFEIMGDGSVRLRVALTNKDVTTGFFVKEVGIYAKYSATNEEVLYSYTNSGVQSDFLPSEGGATVVEHIIDLYTVIGNAANVSAVLYDHISIATKLDVVEVDNDLTALTCLLNAELRAGWMRSYCRRVYRAMLSGLDATSAISADIQTAKISGLPVYTLITTFINSVPAGTDLAAFEVLLTDFIAQNTDQTCLIESETTPQDSGGETTDNSTNTGTTTAGDGYVDGGTF